MSNPLVQTILRTLSADLPAAVFHYTTAEAVRGIVESRQIWATDVRHLAHQTLAWVHEDTATKARGAESGRPSGQPREKGLAYERPLFRPQKSILDRTTWSSI